MKESTDVLFQQAEALVEQIEGDIDAIEWFVDSVEAGIERPRSIVVCAACRVEGLIFCGARHWDPTMRVQARAAGVKINQPHEQGFIDQYGNFLTREEAMVIVKQTGQPFDEDRNGHHNKLYSEGLY